MESAAFVVFRKRAMGLFPAICGSFQSEAMGFAKGSVFVDGRVDVSMATKDNQDRGAAEHYIRTKEAEAAWNNVEEWCGSNDWYNGYARYCGRSRHAEREKIQWR
jgi:hypothetical protein